MASHRRVAAAGSPGSVMDAEGTPWGGVWHRGPDRFRWGRRRRPGAPTLGDA